MSGNNFGKRGHIPNNSAKAIAKRICMQPDCKTKCSDKCGRQETANSTDKKKRSDSINWSDDESFLLRAENKLEEIFSGQDAILSAPFTSPILTQARQSTSDDCLFNDTIQSGEDENGITSSSLNKDLIADVELDDIFISQNLRIPASLPTSTVNRVQQSKSDFKNIDLNEIGTFEMEDIFHVNDDGKFDVQSTQLFLDTISQVPKSPERKQSKNDTLPMTMGTSFLSKSVLDGIIQGSQYETHESLNSQRVSQAQCGLTTLNKADWQTQSFTDFENCLDMVPAKGNFYGLPEKVKKLIFENKGIQDLYDWQNECLNLPAVRQRKNLIYALPTSGGKTLVAEILILRELICWQRNVLFILPYVSIVQEKVSAMSPFALALDFIVEEYTAGKGKCPPQQLNKRQRLYIASIEKGSVLMDSLIDIERPHEIGLVVVDELHLIGERGRGATLEALLTKVMFLKANIQIVGMSATIGNLNEISAFLKADVYTRGFRPVELKEYIKCGKDLLEINSTGKTIEEMFVLSRSVNYNYSPAIERADPDHLGGLVNECAPENGCLVFCPTRKNCENVAVLLSRIVPNQRFLEHRQSEKVDLMNALDKMCGILSPVLAKTLPYGIAYHHSGLTTEERKYIETAYRFGVVTVICCTSTLAAGVNLPAKRVIIRAPYVGQEFMTLCKYKQMVGRAGRAGLGEAGESILITQSKDNLHVGEMLFSPMDKSLSSLDQQNAVGLQSLIMSVIGLRLADCRRDLTRLTCSTLLAVQADILGISLDDLVLSILRDMFKYKVLKLIETGPKENSSLSNIYTTQDFNSSTRPNSSDRRLFISRSTRFQLTSIGCAAFKAGIDYNRAFSLHKELTEAQQRLILTSYVHLLYLVVCFNSNERGDELFPADANILFREYTCLSKDTNLLFKQLGFTEAHAARLVKTQSVQGPLALKLNRLYKVLILDEVLALVPLPIVASKYNVERGTLQQLISQSTAAASAAVRLCEQIEEFWCFKPLFERIHHKFDKCGTLELEPLMELPAVKINRARQLYAAGFKTLEDVAKTRPMTLVKSVEFMPFKVATEIISAAKIILMKKLDHLEEITEELKTCLRQARKDSERQGPVEKN